MLFFFATAEMCVDIDTYCGDGWSIYIVKSQQRQRHVRPE